VLTSREVRAREHRNTKRRNIIVSRRSSLRPADWTLQIAVAHAELIVVRGESLQVFCFHLDGIVNVTRSIGFAIGNRVAQVLTLGNHIVDADRVRARLDVLVGVVVVERDGAADSDIAQVVVTCWGYTRPEDNGVRVRISGSNAMGEVQTSSIHVRRGRLAFENLWHVDTQARMATGWRVVIDIATPVGKDRRGNGEEGEERKHLWW